MQEIRQVSDLMPVCVTVCLHMCPLTVGCSYCTSQLQLKWWVELRAGTAYGKQTALQEDQCETMNNCLFTVYSPPCQAQVGNLDCIYFIHQAKCVILLPDELCYLSLPILVAEVRETCVFNYRKYGTVSVISIYDLVKQHLAVYCLLVIVLEELQTCLGVGRSTPEQNFSYYASALYWTKSSALLLVRCKTLTNFSAQ